MDDVPCVGSGDNVFSAFCMLVGVTTSYEQEKLLELINRDDALKPQYEDLRAMANAGPLKSLSPKDFEYISCLKMTAIPEYDGSPVRFLDIAQKTMSKSRAMEAVDQIFEYRAALQQVVASFRGHFQRNIASLDRPVLQTIESHPTGSRPSIEAKIAAISLRMDFLQQEIDELRATIDSRVQIHERIVRGEVKIGKYDSDFYTSKYNFASAKQLPESTMASYDHILSKLQALGWELKYDTEANNGIIQSSRASASQIVLSLATECRASLDTMYMEAIHSYGKHSLALAAYPRAMNEEREAIAIEIQSLWDEVVPVAHMAVENEFLKPILDKLKMANEKRDVHNATVCVYTSAVLRFMNQHLSIIADRIELLLYHHRTILKTCSYLGARASESDTGATNDAAMGKHASDFQGFLKDDVAAKRETLVDIIQNHMKIYGSIPVDVTNNLGTPSKNMTVLDKYVKSQAEKGDYRAENLHKLFEGAAKTGLNDTDLGIQLLMDCLIADSNVGLKIPGGVHKDVQLEASVAAMRQQAHQVQTIFQDLKLDGPASAPDFVRAAYQTTVQCLASKYGKGEAGCFALNAQTPVTCPTCVSCLKFEAFLRKWGEHGDQAA